MSSTLSNPRRQTGFTLIEVMIVVVILGILTTIALPAYQDSIRKSRRADGLAALMELSARQERFYAQRGTYATDISSPAGLDFGSSASSDGHYTISATACGAGITTCYVLTASPATPSQQKDLRCTSFSLNSSGVKGATGSTSADCW